jgi:hypothetical protein
MVTHLLLHESESGGSSDHEVHPFMYCAADGVRDSDESVSPRLLNLNWFQDITIAIGPIPRCSYRSCGNCIIMSTGIECVCCTEI